MDVPSSTRLFPHRISLLDLPTEVRLDIFAQLFHLNGTAPSYGYTGPLRIRRQPDLTKHAMLVVSKEISAEYRQVFYERTKFFLRVYAQNAFQGAPELASATSATFEQRTSMQSHPSQILSGTQASARRNFWDAPEPMLRSLRNCTLYIEIGNIADSGRAAHSLSRITRADRDLNQAQLVREEMKTFRSLSELKAADAAWDHALKQRIIEILDQMEQLRTVQLVWDLTVEKRAGFGGGENWTWESLGVETVESLKRTERRRLGKMMVTVGGDRRADHVYTAVKENGKWRELDGW